MSLEFLINTAAQDLNLGSLSRESETLATTPQCFCVLSPFCSSLNSRQVVGSGGCMVECWTVNRGDGGSIPPTAVSKLRQFRSPHICLCLSEGTLKADGPFYLVSTTGRSKRSHTGGKCVTCSGLSLDFKCPAKGPVQYLGEREKVSLVAESSLLSEMLLYHSMPYLYVYAP